MVRVDFDSPVTESQETTPDPMEPLWAQPIENSWRNPRLRFQGNWPVKPEGPVHPSLPPADIDDFFRMVEPVQPSDIPKKKPSAHRKRLEMLKAQGPGQQLTTANVHRHNLFQKRGKRRRGDNDSTVANSATSSRSSRKPKPKSKAKEREVLCYRPKPEGTASAKELAEYDVIEKEDLSMDDA